MRKAFRGRRPKQTAASADPPWLPTLFELQTRRLLDFARFVEKGAAFDHASPLQAGTAFAERKIENSGGEDERDHAEGGALSAQDLRRQAECGAAPPDR
ncbi:hypothetical protein ACQR1W_28900 [Bradyrhizobium sp. HKCCYLS1011]|uniref:hypothetical protein n=1 Tax=Bradyrhizobium sp. HKCCYLS1011 TaxID=3420733 RepID=UPI003EC07906